jgi:hypothetical protein
MISSCIAARGSGVKLWCLCINQNSDIFSGVDASMPPVVDSVSLSSTPPNVEVAENAELARLRSGEFDWLIVVYGAHWVSGID